MTEQEIQKLIDSYLEGNTSPEEERLLARELLRPDLPEEWQAVRLMLGELAMGEAEYDAIMASRQAPAVRMQRQAPVVRMQRRWIAAAASLLLLIGVGTMVWMQQDDATQPAPMVAKVEKPSQAIKATTTEPAATAVEPVEENTSQETAALIPTEKAKTEKAGVVEKPETSRRMMDEDPNIHYASHSLAKDTVPYQDPARVDEFIAKMADYYKVKEGELRCSAPKDSSIVSTVYVFPDKKTVSAGRQEVDIFSRLLQVACWYSDETPGYLLSFSHQQFFFELKDMRQQLHYRWIAERVNGKILLYCTHAPLGTKESSTCYQEYRDELMHIKSINNKTKKI